MKKERIQELLEESIENAKHDRDIAKVFMEIYQESVENSFSLASSNQLSKLFEALSRSNEQIIKASGELLKTEKEYPVDLGEEEETMDSLFEKFEAAEQKS